MTQTLNAPPQSFRAPEPKYSAGFNLVEFPDYNHLEYNGRPATDYVQQRGSELYFEGDDPKLIRYPYEFLCRWIPRQQMIIGNMYNLLDPFVLSLLAKVPSVNIVVNFQEWMERPARCPAASRDQKKKDKARREQKWHSIIHEWYPKIRHRELDRRSGKFSDQSCCGVTLYGGDNEKANEKYPWLMHEKFLVGHASCVQQKTIFGDYDFVCYGNSLLYGSFNISGSACHNVESMIYTDRDPLLHESLQLRVAEVQMKNARKPYSLWA